jgi:hypothetical protein
LTCPEASKSKPIKKNLNFQLHSLQWTWTLILGWGNVCVCLSVSLYNKLWIIYIIIFMYYLFIYLQFLDQIWLHDCFQLTYRSFFILWIWVSSWIFVIKMSVWHLLLPSFLDVF